MRKRVRKLYMAATLLGCLAVLATGCGNTAAEDLSDIDSSEETECDEEEEGGEYINDLNMVMKKPVIYLYPEETSAMHVEVGQIDFTCTYPEYGTGWEITAEPDGTIHTIEGEREYYCLYYEGDVKIPIDRKHGFVVGKEAYQSFLEEKLALLGLTDKEAQEFIIYWLPVMQKYDRLFLHFVEQEVLEKAVPLTVTPVPDSLIRVYMQFSDVWDEEIEEQEFTEIHREGSTVVEWGGSDLTGER